MEHSDELKEAMEQGGFSIADVLGTAGTVSEHKRRSLLNLLYLLEMGLASHLMQHYEPIEGTNPYESAECIQDGVMCAAAMALLMAQEGEDKPDSPGTLEQTAKELLREVYEIRDVQKRNAIRNKTRQILGPLADVMQVQIVLVNEDGAQEIDLRNEPL